MRAAVLILATLCFGAALLLFDPASNAGGLSRLFLGASLGLFTAMGFFLIFLVGWSLWVQQRLLEFRVMSLMLMARTLLGALFLVSFVPLFFLATPLHMALLWVGGIVALTGAVLNVVPKSPRATYRPGPPIG
jgi:hypothetical protein